MRADLRAMPFSALRVDQFILSTIACITTRNAEANILAAAMIAATAHFLAYANRVLVRWIRAVYGVAGTSALLLFAETLSIDADVFEQHAVVTRVRGREEITRLVKRFAHSTCFTIFTIRAPNIVSYANFALSTGSLFTKHS